jgi:hypothetical protein
MLAMFEEGNGKKETEKENQATKALRIGEALYTEARIRLHESLPPRIERFVKECAHA